MFQVSTPVSLPCFTTPLVPSSVHSFTAGINRPNGVALPKAIFKKLPTVGATSFTIISPKEFTCLALSVSNTLRFASSLDACIRAYVSFIFFPKSKSLVLMSEVIVGMLAVSTRLPFADKTKGLPAKLASCVVCKT